MWIYFFVEAEESLSSTTKGSGTKRKPPPVDEESSDTENEKDVNVDDDDDKHEYDEGKFQHSWFLWNSCLSLCIHLDGVVAVEEPSHHVKVKKGMI